MHKTLTHGTGKSVYKSMAQSMLLNAFSNALQCVVEFSGIFRIPELRRIKQFIL